jgi:GNAT superfamily N-acetyltransferase
MIIDELFEAPQQCPECGGISFSDLILAEKKDACYYKVKSSAKVWPSAYASGRLVQCRKKGAGNYGNKSEGVMEMDKSQTPPGRDGSTDSDAGKKEYTAKIITPKKAVKDGAKILNKVLNKKKGVAEGSLSEKINPKTLTRGFVQEKDMGWYTLQAVGDFASRMANEPPTMEIYAMLKPEAGQRDGKQIGQLSLKIAQGRFLKDNPGAEALVAGGVDVDAAYQRKGVASSMYQFAKELGNDVIASVDQSDDAVAMWKGMQAKGVAEDTAQPLSVQQLATISDEALDNAYGYGRSTSGNTFGWQANLKSAAFAKQMIDQGVTDIEAISDAIHKGWNTTAQAFVQNPKQFDDTAKLAAAGKLEAKLQQRAQLMKQNYAQLPEEEKEKDRVVARALLQALRGSQQPGIAEGKADYNFDIEDLKRLERIRDLATLKAQALALISKPSAKPMKPEKVEWFKNALERMNSPMKVIKLMYDLLLSGEGNAVVGTRSSMNPNSYRQRFGEQGMAEGNKKSEPPEADYGADYQDMVARVKKLAGLGPMKTVYDPTRRVYRNVPTAVQPPKK